MPAGYRCVVCVMRMSMIYVCTLADEWLFPGLRARNEISVGIGSAAHFVLDVVTSTSAGVLDVFSRWAQEARNCKL